MSSSKSSRYILSRPNRAVFVVLMGSIGPKFTAHLKKPVCKAESKAMKKLNDARASDATKNK
ncbi:MAG TPA: hypothetical protein VK578_00155 [Edaphobacter sp.]|nr:hypothetical protein [Edaphobacter sp.]